MGSEMCIRDRDGTSLGGGSRFVREGSSGHANTDEVAVFTIDEIMD